MAVRILPYASGGRAMQTGKFGLLFLFRYTCSSEALAQFKTRRTRQIVLGVRKKSPLRCSPDFNSRPGR
jgi:hypothetical protein